MRTTKNPASAVVLVTNDVLVLAYHRGRAIRSVSRFPMKRRLRRSAFAALGTTLRQGPPSHLLVAAARDAHQDRVIHPLVELLSECAAATRTPIAWMLDPLELAELLGRRPPREPLRRALTHLRRRLCRTT